MAITKRSDKGSALTYNEMDDNFDAIAPRTSATGSIQIPAGDTASRDGAPVAGYFRYNTSTNAFEGYQNGAWQGIGGVGSGDVNQSAFSYVTVAGQTTVSADTATDTLEIIAGTNVTITTNATNDSITINSSGTGDQDFAYSSLTGVPSSFPPSAHNQAWSTITATPTTLAGYGITDGATGVQGLQGVEGPEGLQGSDGDLGAQGANGIGISGQQGVQGIQGEWVGVLGPQGVQGDTGAGTQGITGATGFGVQGFQGTDGTQGTLGTSGDPGDLGAQGIQGAAGSVQGLQGTQGDTGPIGNDGEGFQGTQGLQGAQSTQGIQGGDGPAGFGLQGIQGIQGDLGPEGPAGVGLQGIQGPVGIQGVQGTDGDIGTQGVQGLVGPASDIQGAQGATGVGDTGAQGFQGIQGVGQTGTDGSQGAQGLQGSQGTQGTQGLVGIGEAGTQGTAGEDGAQGISGIEGVGLQGFQGTQGVQGFTGTGIQGVQGLQSIQGLQGDEGFQGNFGPQGTTGLGTAGIQGTQGTFGLQGTQSVQGLIGPVGAQGAQGTIGIQGFTGIQGLQSIQGLQGIDNGLSYASFSAVNAVPAGEGTLGYNNTTGVFEYTPAILGTAAAVDVGVTTGTIPLAEDVVLIDANNNVSITGDVSLGDNNKLIFGDGSDLQIYHDGNNSIISDGGVGDLLINADNIQLRDTAGNPYLLGNTGAETRLYYNGGTKLATSNTGIDVTGTVTADGLVVDGGALVRSGNTLTLNRTDNATGGEVSYVAGTGFILNDVNGDGTSFNVGTANRMRIDTAGNVGIGTDTPSGLAKTLNIDGGLAGSSIALDGGDNFSVFYTGATADDPTSVFSNTGFKFATATAKDATGFSEKMRLDSSGNLLVGKTAPDAAVAGSELKSDGTAVFSRSSTSPTMYVSTLGSDGDLISFRKDSVTVGSIGSAANGTEVYLTGAGANTSGIFCSNGNALLSMKAGVLANGTQDLGSSSYKFKDLYLSDGAYASFIAGQGDANTSINFPGSDVITFNNGGLEAMRIDAAGNVEISTGDVLPGTSTQDLGSVTSPWQNVYTQDLVLSNESRAEGNSVDGTKGNWTIQEGEEHLYIINNKNGKKYKFALEEIM